MVFFICLTSIDKLILIIRCNIYLLKFLIKNLQYFLIYLECMINLSTKEEGYLRNIQIYNIIDRCYT